jgi:hypothetical protein
MRYALVVLLVLIGLCSSAQSNPFSGGTVIPYGTQPAQPQPPQNIYIISRTEYMLDDTHLNEPGVAILLSAWQSGTPNGDEVPGVDIYITGGPTQRRATTDRFGYIFVKWPFADSDKEKDWYLQFSLDPKDPYAPGSASTSVCAHVPEDKSSFTNLSDILGPYSIYKSAYLRGLPLS